MGGWLETQLPKGSGNPPPNKCMGSTFSERNIVMRNRPDLLYVYTNDLTIQSWNSVSVFCNGAYPCCELGLMCKLHSPCATVHVGDYIWQLKLLLKFGAELELVTDAS